MAPVGRVCVYCGVKFFVEERYLANPARGRFCGIPCSNRGAERRAPSGEEHYAWKGDAAATNTKRARARRQYDLGSCARCGSRASDRHHKDGDTGNNTPENIEILCRRCHMRVDGRLDGFRSLARANGRKKRKAARECPICGRSQTLPYNGMCHACDARGRRRWRKAVDGRLCVICSGRAVDGHHRYPKQRLKFLGRTAAVWDPRNCCPVCRACHNRIEARLTPCPTPPAYGAFLIDHELPPLPDREAGAC